MNVLASILLAVLLPPLHGVVARDAAAPARLRGDGSRHPPGDGPRSCDESFPLADPDSLRQLLPPSSRGGADERLLLVSVPDDETRRSYAPLCESDDGGDESSAGMRRIDIRNLMRCNSGSCFNDYYQQCTFECTWSPPTPDNTAKPTPSPTIVSQTHNHVLLKLQKLAEQYRLTASIRAAIVEFVKGLIQQKMGYDLEILDAEWPGRLPGEPHSLPLNITALGPTDVSQFSLPYILELLRENESDLIEYLKTLDGGVPFNHVGIEVDTYDPNDILAGDTEAPIASPTAAPIAMEDRAKADAVIMKATKVESGGIPWWVWLLLAVIILGLICCGGWCCLRSKRESKEIGGMNKGGGSDINISVAGNTRAAQSTATGMRSHRTRGTRGGDNASRMTSRTRRTSRPAVRARTIVGQSFTRKRFPEEERSHKSSSSNKSEGSKMYDDLTLNMPAMAAVSVLPENEGFDPPEEQYALVPYSAGTAPPRDPTMVSYSSPRTRVMPPRDPTMHSDGQVGEEESKAEEPDGLKVSRKKSIFAADAVQNDRIYRSRKKRSSASARRDSFGDRLKSSITWKKPLDVSGNDDPSEYYGPNRNEPEGLTSDEVDDYYGSRTRLSFKTQKKNRRSAQSGEGSARLGSFGDRLKSSFTWKPAREDQPFDIDFDDDDIDDSHDSPSMLTTGTNNRMKDDLHPRNDRQLRSGDLGAATARKGHHNDEVSIPSYAPSQSSKKKKNKKGHHHRGDGRRSVGGGGSGTRENRTRQGIFSSLKRKTSLTVSEVESIDV